MGLLLNGMKKGMCLLVISLFSLTLIAYQSAAAADEIMGIDPALDIGMFIPLTPGSSTTLNIQTSGDFKFDFGHLLNMNLTTVLCLGEGTLTVELTKDDTINDMVNMFIIGYPADPLFVPNFGITPAKISVSTDINNTMGGFGIVFVFSGVNSSESHKYKLSLELD